MENNTKTKLIYRLGSDSGFFSEVNNMILAIIYCIENNLEFQLYSKNGNYSCDDAWLDYFEPFTTHRYEFFHHVFNYRPGTCPLPEKLIIEELLEKRNNEKVLLTQHIWSKIDDNHVFNANKWVNSPGINGRFLCVTKEIIQSIWKYNKQTNDDIRAIVDRINIPVKYDSLHIRRGDKITEVMQLPSINQYFDKLNLLTNGEDLPIYIATDDYSVIAEIKSMYPYKKIFYSDSIENNGFDMKIFSSLPKESKHKQIIHLLADIEMLKNSRCFVGTFSSNIGMFMGMCRSDAYAVDSDTWLNWRGLISAFL